MTDLVRLVTTRLGLERDPAEAAVGPDRRYALVSDRYSGFLAGRLADGSAAIVSLWNLPASVEVLRFDADGELAGADVHELPEGVRPGPPERPGQPPTSEQLAPLRDHLGLTEEKIELRSFLTQDGRGVRPLPSHYLEFLVDPHGPGFTDDDRQYYPDDLRDWIGRRGYVLLWGNDFWMSADGRVEST
jgi:hypothetical protein